jgi:2-methylisocitrate lyase-like PEP mutase family enzyme
MPARPQDADKFHALHEDFLILPNAWDAASARLVQEAGAKAIATSSAAVAWAHGYADGHGLPISILVTAVQEIARVVSVPITVDAEGGYSDDLAQIEKNIALLIDAGGVGINLEDGKQSHELHLKKIEAARNAGERAGVKLFINARTDVYLKKLFPAEEALDETMRRGWACKKAGANGFFVPGVADSKQISAIAQEVDIPLNVIAMAGVPKAAELRALGAKRLSGATRIFGAAMAGARAATEAFLRDGDSDALTKAQGTPPNWNEMFKG